MYKTIVWATDGSQDADRALPSAIELARDGDAKLLVVHADERLGGRAAGAPVLADEDDIVSAPRTKVKTLVDTGVDAELFVVHGLNREPADLIAEAAKESGADVIVVGTRGHGRLAGMVLGSVAQRLLHVAPCPVLAVPPHAEVPSTLAAS
jgi:nucleotide-binding universal stress UspA family protein